jgi:hypoxanthine phosphoribosyltransferase
MERIFGRPIITQEEVQKRIRELGNQISIDYQGKEILMVGVLKGAFAFYADLARAIHAALRVDFVMVSSRRSGAKKGGVDRKIKVISDLAEDVTGQDVLLVEDIVDSGMTISQLKKRLLARKPRSLRVCTLLDKPERRRVRVVIDYVGFKIPDKYVVGYGLDYQNKYRNLPYVAVLDKVVADDELSYWQE